MIERGRKKRKDVAWPGYFSEKVHFMLTCNGKGASPMKYRGDIKYLTINISSIHTWSRSGDIVTALTGRSVR